LCLWEHSKSIKHINPFIEGESHAPEIAMTLKDSRPSQRAGAAKREKWTEAHGPELVCERCFRILNINEEGGSRAFFQVRQYSGI
jgi:hypothetical protein